MFAIIFGVAWIVLGGLVLYYTLKEKQIVRK